MWCLLKTNRLPERPPTDPVGPIFALWTIQAAVIAPAFSTDARAILRQPKLPGGPSELTLIEVPPLAGGGHSGGGGSEADERPPPPGWLDDAVIAPLTGGGLLVHRPMAGDDRSGGSRGGGGRNGWHVVSSGCFRMCFRLTSTRLPPFLRARVRTCRSGRCMEVAAPSRAIPNIVGAAPCHDAGDGRAPNGGRDAGP